MPEDPKKLIGQISDILAEVNKHAKFETRLSLLERDVEDFHNESDIHKMISKRINAYDQACSKNKINWTMVIQAVIIATLSALGAAMVVRGG